MRTLFTLFFLALSILCYAQGFNVVQSNDEELIFESFIEKKDDNYVFLAQYTQGEISSYKLIEVNDGEVVKEHVIDENKSFASGHTIKNDNSLLMLSESINDTSAIHLYKISDSYDVTFVKTLVRKPKDVFQLRSVIHEDKIFTITLIGRVFSAKPYFIVSDLEGNVLYEEENKIDGFLSDIDITGSRLAIYHTSGLDIFNLETYEKEWNFELDDFGLQGNILVENETTLLLSGDLYVRGHPNDFNQVGSIAVVNLDSKLVNYKYKKEPEQDSKVAFRQALISLNNGDYTLLERLTDAMEGSGLDKKTIVRFLDQNLNYTGCKTEFVEEINFDYSVSSVEQSDKYELIYFGWRAVTLNGERTQEPYYTIVSNICSVTSEEILTKSKEMLVYPNPASEYLWVDINHPFSYTISNMLQEVVREGVSDSNKKIYLSGITSGVYILSFYDEYKRVVQSIKFVKA